MFLGLGGGLGGGGSGASSPGEGLGAGASGALPIEADVSKLEMGDVIVVKPQAFGGPDLAVRAIRLAQQFGATAVVTTIAGMKLVSTTSLPSPPE